jgi:hypothetical protein
MSKELKLLNFICVVVALGFLAMVVVSALFSGSFLSIDNLFIIVVSLVMALLFAINPLLYLKSEGRLPIPFMKKSLPAPAPAAGRTSGQVRASTPPLLDAKGRAVPPDVRELMARFGPSEAKDA